MSETTQSSFKPGWQILEEAAQAVLEPKADGTAARYFEIQMVARNQELIPDDHKVRMLPTLVSACVLVCEKAQAWPGPFTGFFEVQIGRETLTDLLAEHTAWQIREYSGSPIGYVVLNGNYREPVNAADLQVASRIGFQGPIERSPSGLLIPAGQN